MRALGLDIGSARIGVAVSDPTGSVASPLAVLDGRDVVRAAQEIRRLAEDYEAEVVVVGLPLTLAGEEGPQAAEVRAVVEQLSVSVGLDVVYQDERNSSAEARRAMSAAGVSAKEQRGTLDKVAASIVLQTWLDSQRDTAEC